MTNTEQPDEKATKEQSTKTEWHLLFAVEQDLALTPVGIGVEAEFSVMKESPKVDLLLLRRTGNAWTKEQRARLPDGIRESTAVNNLLEFKYTESLTISAIIQALSYEHFFRTTRRLRAANVRLFMLIAQTPSTSKLREFGFVPTNLPGVLVGENIYVRHVTLLLLNELRNVPHDAFVKTFASRQTEKQKAFEQLDTFDDLPIDLFSYLQGLRTIWSLPKGAEMDERLTPERVMEVGEVWKKKLLQSMSSEEIEVYFPTYRQSILAQGLEQGIEQGREQGIEQGREQGLMLAKREAVQAMHTRNFDVSIIADITGLTVEQVNAIIADLSDTESR